MNNDDTSVHNVYGISRHRHELLNPHDSLRSSSSSCLTFLPNPEQGLPVNVGFSPSVLVVPFVPPGDVVREPRQRRAGRRQQRQGHLQESIHGRVHQDVVEGLVAEGEEGADGGRESEVKKEAPPPYDAGRNVHLSQANEEDRGDGQGVVRKVLVQAHHLLLVTATRKRQDLATVMLERC